MYQEQKNDKWRGALFDKFEQDIESVPEVIFPKIEKKIYSRKKNKLVLVLLISFLLLSVLMMRKRGLNSSTQEEVKQSIIKIENSKNRKANKETSKIRQDENLVAGASSVHALSLLETSKNRTKNNSNSSNLIADNLNLDFDSLSPNNKFLISNTLGEIRSEVSYLETKNKETDHKEFSDSLRNKWSKLNLALLSPWLITKTKKQIINLSYTKTPGNKNYFISLDVNRGIQVRRIGGVFETENLKSKTIGTRRIPSSLNYYQFLFGKQQTRNLSFLGGIGFGYSNFQSRWFYRQLFKQSQEQELRFTTFEGIANLQSDEINNELNGGDTVLYRLRANYNSWFFSIPIGFKYNLNEKRFSPFFRYSLNLDFHSKGNLSLDIQGQNFQKNYKLNFENNQFSLALQQQIGFGFSFQLLKNWNLFSEARVSIPLTRRRITNENYLRTSFLTLGFGLTYNI